MSAPWEDSRVRAGLPRQLAMRRRMLNEGAVGIGWKVAFGAPSWLELMQISAPLVGFLTDATLFESGATVETTGWEGGVVEFEVAVYLGEDLGPGMSEDEAGAAIAAVGPAIELANVDLPLEASGLEDILAGDIFHQGVILGDPDRARTGLDLTDLVARVLVDGEERAAMTDLPHTTGAYRRIVGTVANTLAAQGETLRAGEVIITGSLFPPMSMSEGTNFTFALDPLDPISVRIEG